MRKTIAILLMIGLMLPAPAMATFAPEGTTGGAASSSGGGTSGGGAEGGSTDADVQCKGCEENRFPMGKGGGRSADKNESGAAQMIRNNKKSDEAAEKVAKTAEESQNKEDSDLMNNLMDCISGINTNIFSGDFSGILDKIVQSVMKALCNFAKRKSAEYINKALSAATFDLPGGLGTIGANTTILGHTWGTISQTGSLKDSGISYDGKAVLGNPTTTGSSSASAQAGYQMFKNGGSIILNSKGLIDESAGNSAGGIFDSIFK